VSSARLKSILAATTFLAGAGLASAQEPPLGLRGSTAAAGAALPPVASGATGLSPGSIAPPPPPGVSPGSVTTGRRALRRPTTRRSRPPTSAIVRAPFRPTLVAPGLETPVQPLVTGLPDLAAPPVAGPPRRRPVEADPYAPLGIKLGSITLFPVLGESIGYDTNPNRTSLGKRGSFVSQTEGELGIQSDWSRHALTGQLRGAYNLYTENPDASRPEGAGRLGLRLDVTRDTQINIDGRYQIDTQRPDSPDLNATVRERPIIATEGATLGVTHRFNRLLGTIQATIDRADFEDARLANGILLDQSDRNVTQYGVRGRLGYEFSPSFIPFAEIVADTRAYDRRIDNSGFRRSSDGLGARVGAAFELTRLITGEISAGAIQRSYDDPRLRDLTSPLLEAALVWAVTPLTTVRATAQANVDETTIPNATGVRTVRGALEVSHALRRNLIVTAGITASDFDYSGVPINEQGFGALIRADYKLTRSLGVRASYSHERISSSIANSSYDSDVFLLGMRFTP
jgi:hypothetical protein